MIRVSLDTHEIPEVIEALERMPNAFVSSVLARTAVALKQEAPAASGQTARSIRHLMTGEAEGEVIVDTIYASFTHDGRGAGRVDFGAVVDWAKSKGKTASDGFAIAHSIAKKGTRPNPWVNDFVESNRMTTIMQNVAKQVTADVA